MRVFGRRGRIDVRWERTCPDRAPTRLDSAGLNQAPHVVGRWVRQARDATGLGWCSHDVGGRTSAAAPSTLDRVAGVEDEGTGHPGKRQVERHVEEDRQDERPAVSHGANSNSEQPLGQADEHGRDREHGYNRSPDHRRSGRACRKQARPGLTSYFCIAKSSGSKICRISITSPSLAGHRCAHFMTSSFDFASTSQ